MTHRSIRRGALVAAALALHAPLSAQTSGPTAIPAPATPPPTAQARVPLRIGPVTVTGSIRARGEGWDWFSAPGYDDEYAFGATLIRLSGAYSNARVDVQAELSQPTLFALPDNAVAPAPQGQLGMGASYRAASGTEEAGIFLKQAFVRVKGIGGAANSARIGRFEFLEGSEVTPADASLAWVKRERVAQRLIGSFGFSHAQRSLDGVQVVRNTRRANVTVLAAFPTRGVFSMDGQGTLDEVNLQYAAITLPFAHTDARLFGIRYEDGRELPTTDNRPAALRNAERREGVEILTLGGHLARTQRIAGGTADFLLWGALQTGDWATQSHGANAFAAEIGYQPPLTLRPWVRAGYLRGSGDDTPETVAGGEHESFFQILPTPRIYARTPFYNLMNSEDRFAQLLLRPNPATTLRIDLHSVRVAESIDLWYAGGGAFDETVFGYQGRPTGGESSIGTLLDLSLDRTFGMYSATLYLGNVDGGPIISRIHPGGSGGRYGYVELTRRF